MLSFWLTVSRTLKGSCLLCNFQTADSELAQKIDLSLLLFLWDDILAMLISH